MKLRFNREETADALGAICTVATGRTPKEILKCVRLEARSDVLLLAATDQELSVRCAATQVEVDKPGEVLVVADTLARIVRECADEVLSLETSGNTLHIRGQGSHFQIVSQDTADFPAVPAMEGDPDVTVDFGTMRRLIELTSFAAARESTRYAINGVLWEVDGKRLTMAATDGRRLALAHGKLTGKGSSAGPHAIIPIKALSLLARLTAEPDVQAGIRITENQLLVDLGRTTISSTLVEGQFPKYQDVVPRDCDRVVELNTAEFLSALKRAALLTNEESKGVRLAFADGTLTLSSRAPEQGEATVSMPVQFKGDPLEIGFNPAFLLDVLRVVHADEISLAMKEPNRPGIVRIGDEYQYVVMPVNLASA